MKEFLIKSFIFTSILFISLAIIEKDLSKIPNSYSVKRNCVENNLPNLNLLVFGSSQAHYDINPEIIMQNSCNLANSNQDIYYDNQLLNKYINKLPKLNLVILNISYFSLEFKLSNTEESWRKYFYYHFFKIPYKDGSLLDINNFSLISLYTPENSLNYILKGFKVDLSENNTKNGWYRVSGISNSDIGKLNAIRHTGYMESKLVPENLAYLEDTISTLQKRNIHVVLTTMPTTKSYFDNIDQNKYNSLQNNISLLSHKYGIEYLNYIQDDRFKNADFIDSSDHLNSDGASKFSAILKQDLISKQLIN